MQLKNIVVEKAMKQVVEERMLTECHFMDDIYNSGESKDSHS